MAALRSIPNLNGSQPSDEEIIQFINENIDNEDLLTEYFSKLTRPLTANILTLKLPFHVDGDDDPEEYNFLGHAGRGTKYFKYLVKLATPEAIDAALAEDPLNVNSGTALHAILLKQRKLKKEGVLELIQKASEAIINDVLVKQCLGVTPLFLALQSADESVACELLKKANRESINNAAQMIYFGLNILEWIAHKRRCTKNVIEAFFSQLTTETIDSLMSLPGMGGHTLFNQLIMKYAQKEGYDWLICTLAMRMSPSSINTLAKQKIHSEFDILSWFIFFKVSPIVVDAICSRLEKSTMDELILKGGVRGATPLLVSNFKDTTNFLGLPSTDITKQTNATAACIIKYVSEQTLAELIKQPFHHDKAIELVKEIKKEKKLDKSPATLLEDGEERLAIGFLEDMSINNAPMFNELVRKMLLAGERVNLTVKALYRLEAYNLSRYLAMHPEVNLDELRKAKAHSMLVNWKYKLGFDIRLKEAKQLLQNEILFSLTVYRYLKGTHLLEPLALIVIGYIERDLPIINRVNYEIRKEKHPSEVSELKLVYSSVQPFFARDEELKYKHDEGSVILSYLSDQTSTDVAVHEFKQERSKSTPPKKPKVDPNESKNPSVSGNFFLSLFGARKPKEDKSNLHVYIKKMDAAKKAIADFTKIHNQQLEEKHVDTPVAGMAPKTFAEIKKYYQASRNEICLAKIEELEKNLNLAVVEYQQECIKSIMKAWGNTHGKKPPLSGKKISQANQLMAEAKQFGYECKDMKHDGNCFYRAIADQLALKGLSHLGANHEAIRATAMAYVLKHLNEYQNYLDEHDGDINQFIAQNINPGTWADHLVISALSRALNVNIVIVRSDGAAPNIFKQNAPVATLHIGNEVGLHYQSLIENIGLIKTKSLQAYIDAAAIDLPLQEPVLAGPRLAERIVFKQ